MTFNKKILKNGLRVITVPMADNPSATVLVMVEAGSKYETKETSGISHFLEHMIFKGTPTRPKASDISRELDSIGAQYNAYTTQEFTCYFAKADARHLDKILDIVSDMYLNPLFEEKEINKEKGVIVEEIRMYNDLPQRQVHEVFEELLHGDQPAGWSVIGTETTVKSFTKQNFVDYRAGHYVSGATTVVVAGSFDENKVLAAIEQAFADMSPEGKKAKLAVSESQHEPAIRTAFKETDQTHLVLGVRTFSILDPRAATMSVLSVILGGGMSSRLFSRMRDDLGICYYIRASHNPSTDHGDLTISAGVDNSRVEEAVKEILAQCRKLKDELVSEAELRKAKDYMAGTTLLELETSDSRAEFGGYQETIKHIIETPEQLIKKVNAVTAQDVQNLAREIFVNEGLNMAIIGRFKDGGVFKDYFKF